MALVHLQILVSKLDTVSNEEFHKYWSESHPKIWLGIKVVQEKVVKYSQFHINRQVVDAPKTQGVQCADYDGVVDIWANSTEDLMAVFQDEEYLRVVVPDEESFLKRTDAKMMVGHDEEKKLVEGKVITS